MKIAVINFSGNVGKSTISRHLLIPRISNAVFISVESINADEGGEKISAKQFDELQALLLSDRPVVVDVGASNIEVFIRQMTQYRNSHDDFDFFIVPVVKEKKSQADTIATVKALAAIAVPAKKIRVVFNKVDAEDDVDSEFSALINFEKAERQCQIRPGSTIYANEVFETIKSLNVPISELVAHETDYRPEHKSASTPEQKARFVRLILAKRLAQSAQENLDAVVDAVVR
jgi:hypothetical protein